MTIVDLYLAIALGFCAFLLVVSNETVKWNELDSVFNHITSIAGMTVLWPLSAAWVLVRLYARRCS